MKRTWLFLIVLSLLTTFACAQNIVVWSQPGIVQFKSNAASATTISVTLGSAPTAGDLLVCGVTHDGTTANSLVWPSGFTPAVAAIHAGSLVQDVRYHVVLTGDPSTYSVAGSTSADMHMSCYEMQQLNTTTAISAVATLADTAPTTNETTGTNTLSAPTRAITFWGTIGGGTGYTPNTSNYDYDVASGTLNAHGQHSGIYQDLSVPLQDTLTYQNTPTDVVATAVALTPIKGPMTLTTIASASTPTPAPTPTPTATPTPTVGVKSHVLTAEYLWSATEVNTPKTTYAPWLDWSIPRSDQEYAAKQAGLKTYIYDDFYKAYSSDNDFAYNDIKPGGANAAAEAKNCSGTPITYAASGGTVYVTDPRTAAAKTHANAIIANWQSVLPGYNGGHAIGTLIDAYFSDDTVAVPNNHSPCGYTASAGVTGINAISTNTGVPLIINALVAYTMANEQTEVQLMSPSNVIAAMYEDCYDIHGWNTANPNDTKMDTGKEWLEAEYGEIYAVAHSKIFWCLGTANGDGATATSLDIRMYSYASFLLTYDPSYALFQTAHTTSPSTFKVFPETGFVPMNPTATATDVSGYQLASGIYQRNFNDCYYRAARIGSCAIVVNPSPSKTINVSSTGYNNIMVLHGDGVLDGGSVTFNGTIPTTLAPTEAAILIGP